jgi:hypothetical protein
MLSQSRSNAVSLTNTQALVCSLLISLLFIVDSFQNIYFFFFCPFDFDFKASKQKKSLHAYNSTWINHHSTT